MKRLLYIIAAMMTYSVSVQAQTSSDTILTDTLDIRFSGMPYKVYCEITSILNNYTAQTTVEVNFGQSQTQNNTLVDNEGRPIVFNSNIDAMNYMSRRGWEFEQIYIDKLSGKDSDATRICHCIMSKFVNPDNPINEGFKVKAQFKKRKDRK